MRWIRAGYRLAGIGCVTVGGYLAYLARLPLRRSPAARERLRVATFGGWARRVTRLLRMRIDVRGRPPAEPCVLVSNHLSYVDIVVLAAHLDAIFVAKSEVAGWPVLGPMTRAMGTIFVNRTAVRELPRVNDSIERALAAGHTVVIFPEGTSTRGEEVLPFRPSLLEPAVRTSYPVGCASLSYRTPPGEPPASLSVCWWGDMPFFGHAVGLVQLSQFDATLHFGEALLREKDRKVLARESWRAVRERFERVR